MVSVCVQYVGGNVDSGPIAHNTCIHHPHTHTPTHIVTLTLCAGVMTRHGDAKLHPLSIHSGENESQTLSSCQCFLTSTAHTIL